MDKLENFLYGIFTRLPDSICSRLPDSISSDELYEKFLKFSSKISGVKKKLENFVVPSVFGLCFLGASVGYIKQFSDSKYSNSNRNNFVLEKPKDSFILKNLTKRAINISVGEDDFWSNDEKREFLNDLNIGKNFMEQNEKVGNMHYASKINNHILFFSEGSGYCTPLGFVTENEIKSYIYRKSSSE